MELKTAKCCATCENFMADSNMEGAMFFDGFCALHKVPANFENYCDNYETEEK